MFRIYCGGLIGDEESSNDDLSLHLKAILVEKSFVFELHLEETKLLCNIHRYGYSYFFFLPSLLRI